MRKVLLALFVLIFFTLRSNAVCVVTVTPGLNDTICNGSSVVLHANGATTYNWSPATGLSATTGANVTASPNATITYTLIGNCPGNQHDTLYITIVVRPSPTAHAGASQDICAGLSAQLGATPAATGGTGPYTYSWSPGGSAAQHPNVSPAATTTYTLTVTDANGCTDTSQTVVYVHPNPVAAFTFSPNNVCSNLPINFTNTSTGSNLTYLWNFGDGATATSQNASHVYNVVGNATGVTFTVKLKVTTAFGCTDSVTHVVTVNQVPSTAMGGPEFNAPALFKKCTAVGSWTFTFTLNTNNVNTTVATNTNYTIVFGGGAPATFTTTNAGAFPITHSYPTGTYNLLFIVTGTNGCVDTGFYTVFVGSNPSVGLSNPGNTNGCAPFTLTFPVTNTINNPPGTTYIVTYSDGSAVQVFNNPPASLTHTFSISSCGYTTIGGIPNAFYVRIVATNPCGTSAATVEPIYIAIPPIPQFTTSPPSPGCVNIPMSFINTSINGTDPANGDCGTTPPLYWTITPTTGYTVGGSLGSSNGNNDPQFWTQGSTSISLNFSVPGNYTICLHVGNICIVDSSCQTVCINPSLTPAFTLTPTVGCIPLAVTTNNTTPTPTCGANSYSWTVFYTASPPCGNSSSFSFTGGTNASSANPSFLFSTAGVYTVTLTVTNPCGTFSTSHTVTVKKPPIVTVTPVTNSCSNPYVVAPSATVTNCGTSALTYSWTFGGGTPASSTSASPGNISFSGTGNHTITLAATNECGTASNNTSFTIYVLPIANAGPDVTICNGNFTTLNGSGSSGTPGYSYFWTPSTGLSSQFSSSPNASPNVTTTYTLTVTDANGCTGTDQVIVTVNPLPVATATPASQTFCSGGTTAIALSSNVGGTTYAWTVVQSGVTGASAGSGNNIAQTLSTTGAATGTATYTITPTAPGPCPGAPIVVVITVNPIPVVNAGSNVVLCNQPIPYNLTGFSPAGGTWTGPGVTAGGVFTPSAVGVFVLTYTFTNGNNCTANDTMSVTVINPQIANAGNGFNICVNGAITALPAATPAGGTWSGAGVVGTNFNPATAGVGAFNLTYTFGTGTCLTTDTIHVTVNPLPSVGVNNATICVGQSTVLTANGANTYSWTPNTNLSATTGTSVTANPVSTIVYTVTGTTTATGCSNTATSTVTVNSLPIVNAGNNVVLCNQPIPYSLTGFSPAGGTWTGTGVTPAGVFTPSAVGVFVLTYTFTNGNNCTANDTMSVTVIAPQVANAGTGFSICINAAIANLVGATPAGGTWSGTGVVGSTFNPVTAGVGNFTLTYSFGTGTCLSTDTIQVVVNPLPNVTVNSPTYCFGNSALLTANGANTYVWSPATNLSATTGTSVTANPNSTTNYTVTGTAVTGCVASAVSTVTVNPLPVPSFTLPALGCMNAVINFNNTSTGGNTYAWNFGDGGLSALQNPTHTYLSTGNFTVHLVVTSALGCVDSINHTIQIVTTPAPSFTLNPFQGCPPLIVTFNNTSTGYQPTYSWNFGNGQTFLGANPPQITYQQGIIGDTTYYITLTTTNICGSVSIVDSVIVHPIPLAAFLPSSLVGCSPFVCSFLNTTTGNPTSFLWNFGDGSATSVLQNPGTHTFVTGQNDTIFTVTMIASNACGSDTVQIPILIHPNAVVAFAVATPTSGCAPLTVQFSALAQGATYVAWNFGGPGFSSNLNATAIYNNPGTYTAQFFANDGCSYDTVSITINVGGNPNMQFIWNPNPVCAGSTISFTNQTANLINVNWNFGDGTTSNFVNPNHIYPAAGNYNVTLIGTSQTFGCTDSISHFVSVVPTPVNNFTFTPPFGCAPLPVSFTNNTTNATFYNWNFGDGNSSNIMSPVHIYQNAGNFIITLISSTVNGCADTSVSSILINPSPTSAFTMTPPASCSYQVNVLTANASTGATGYAWNFGNGITSTQNNPPITFDTTGNYLVQLIASNGFGCADTAVNIFHVYPQPLAGFFATPVDGCQPLLVQFSDTSHDAVTYNWIFGDGTSSNFPNPLHVYQNPGTYSVQLFISGTNNFCSDSIAHNNYITVYPKPTAAFTWENINSAAPNAQVVFFNSSIGAVNYDWDFGDGENSIDDNPTHFFHTLGNFNVTLISISNHGCLDTTNHLINVDFAHGLFVPNAFTPNNGQNDVHVFLPVGLGLKFYHLQIFDTWGSLIFETTHLDATGAPDEGWDGRKNGTLLPQDAYVWKIDAVFQDEVVWKGNTYDGSYFSKTGTVTLLH